MQLSLCFDYKLHPEKAKLYVEILRDMDLDELHQAVNRHLRYGKSFPLPSELRSSVEVESRPNILSRGSESETSNFAP